MSPSTGGGRRLDGPWGPLVAAVAGFVVYLGVLRNGFAFDDVPIVLGDPRLRGGLHLGAIFGRPYWPGGAGVSRGLYRPLTTLSFAVDHALFGFSPLWFHLENALWHVLACVLVVLLLRRFFSPVAALVGGLVFAVHPVHVEAVANVVGRSELLAGVALLGACLVWLRGAPTPGASGPETAPTPADPASGDEGRSAAGVGRRAPSAAATLSAALLLALALLSKESAVVLLPVLLLLDFAVGRWRARRDDLAAYARASAPAWAGLLLVLAAYVVVRVGVVGIVAPQTPYPAVEALPGRVPRLLTALQAWPVYLRLLFFPRTLLADYGPRIIMPAVAATPAAVIGFVTIVVLLVGGGAAVLRGYRRTALGLLWFPLTILPVSNLLLTIGVLVAERTLYIPSFALSVGAAAAVAALPRLESRARRRLAVGAMAVAILALGVRTVLRVPDWRSTESIFAALRRDRPDSFRAHWYFGRLDRARGDLRQADVQFRRAVSLWPWHEPLDIEAAATADGAHDWSATAEIARFSTRQWPSNISAWRLLAVSTLELGDTTASLRAIRSGLALASRDTLLREMDRALTGDGRHRPQPQPDDAH